MAGMMPQADSSTYKAFKFQRQAWRRCTVTAGILFVLSSVGCSLLKGRSDDKDATSGVSKMLTPPEAPDLIREAGSPRGLNPISIVGVGLVNSLSASGGPADPSSYRDQLIEEMRRNDVKDPNKMLELDSNALVRVRAVVPAGARRGDKIDVRIDSPSSSNVSDLNGGWLLDTRLQIQQVLQGRVRKGDIFGIATGPVLTRFEIEGTNDAPLKTEGVLLAGAVVQKDRKMGFVIRPEYQHVKVASDIAKAINRRFFFFDGSTRRGVAKAVEDDYVEIELHPRYENSLSRYVSVVRAIMIDERKADDQSRLQDLAVKLSDPATAADAALQLEALGESAIPTLVSATQSDNQELRFYAAEALAYLDRREAIGPLEDAIINESAFRYPSLAAMQGFDHPGVADALVRLFDQPSIETRYGAFNTLRTRDDALVALTPEPVGKAMTFYQVPSDAPPAVAVSSRRRSEIVVFGQDAEVDLRGFLLSSGGIIVKAEPGDPSKIRVTRFQAGEPDRRVMASHSVSGIAKGVIGVGGTYGDVVSVLRSAKAKGHLKAQLAIDPLPKALRTYYRDGVSNEDAEADDSLDEEPNSSAPLGSGLQESDS